MDVTARSRCCPRPRLPGAGPVKTFAKAGVWNLFLSQTLLILCSYMPGSCSYVDTWNLQYTSECSLMASREGRCRVSPRIKWISRPRKSVSQSIIPKLKRKHCQSNNKPQIKLQTLQLNRNAHKKVKNYGAGKKEMVRTISIYGNRQQASTVYCSSYRFQKLNIESDFQLSRMSSEMKLLPYSNWFPHFYLIQMEFCTCKQDIKQMIENAVSRWKLWSLEISKFTVAYLIFPMVRKRIRM